MIWCIRLWNSCCAFWDDNHAIFVNSVSVFSWDSVVLITFPLQSRISPGPSLHGFFSASSVLRLIWLPNLLFGCLAFTLVGRYSFLVRAIRISHVYYLRFHYMPCSSTPRMIAASPIYRGILLLLSGVSTPSAILQDFVNGAQSLQPFGLRPVTFHAYA